MHIKLTKPEPQILCDVRGQPIGLDENCAYIEPKNDVFSFGHNLTHNMCSLIPGRFPDHWTSFTTPRSILKTIVNSSPRRSLYPQIDALLNDIKAQRQKHDP